MKTLDTPAARVAEFVRQARRLRDIDPDNIHTVYTDPDAESIDLSLNDLDALVAATQPRIVTTVEELETLAEGTLFISEQGGVWEAMTWPSGDKRFREPGTRSGHPGVAPKHIALPARIIDTPAVGA